MLASNDRDYVLLPGAVHMEASHFAAALNRRTKQRSCDARRARLTIPFLMTDVSFVDLDDLERTPPIGASGPLRMASRMRWPRNHAFCSVDA